MPDSPGVSYVVVFLKNGDAIDVTHLTPEEAVAQLRARGVTLAEIRETVHHVTTLMGGDAA